MSPKRNKWKITQSAKRSSKKTTRDGWGCQAVLRQGKDKVENYDGGVKGRRKGGETMSTTTRRENCGPNQSGIKDKNKDRPLGVHQRGAIELRKKSKAEEK